MLIFYFIQVINNCENGVSSTPVNSKKLSKKIKRRMAKFINAAWQKKREKNGQSIKNNTGR
jgi:hypothetical protein